MSDEYILDDVVETFSDEDTLMSDIIRNNPVKWLLSMAVIGPGAAYTLSGKTSYEAALENWGLPTGLEWILAVFVTGQLVIAPLSCYYLSRTGNVASGIFIAMGGSAILVANPDEIARFSVALGWPFFLFCVALSAPMLLVLKNKKKLLDPGKERLTWCTLLSTAIMMYTVAAVVPSAGIALYDFSCEGDAGATLESNISLSDACHVMEFRYTPMLGMAAAIGLAWPRGKKSLEEEVCTHCGSKNCCLKSSKTKDENSLDGIKDGEKSALLTPIQDDAGALLGKVDVTEGATNACQALQYRDGGSTDDTQQDKSASTWPRGRKIIDDLSDDFLDGLKD